MKRRRPKKRPPRRRNPLPRTKAEQREWDSYLHRRDVEASKKREGACKAKGSSCRTGSKAAAELERRRRRRLRAAAARSRARELEAQRQAASCRAETRACKDAEKAARRDLRQRRSGAARQRREDVGGPSAQKRSAELRREALDEARSHFRWGEREYAHWLDEQIEAGAREYERRQWQPDQVPF